jgi:uncharacterized protein YndB with AHSA1/START domain
MTTAPQTATTFTLPSDREVTMTRTFNAPRELVFAAYTTPEHVKRWWGFRESTMLVCEIDLRVGGAWRYVTREASGEEVPFKGVYKEIVAPQRLVATEIYDVAPFNEMGPAINTLTLAERGGQTTLNVVTLYPSKEVRDTVIEMGMEVGAAVTMDRLAELVEGMAQGRSS